MKIIGCGNEISASILQQFEEEIVVTVSRQFGEKKDLKIFKKIEEKSISAPRRQLKRINFSSHAHEGDIARENKK